MKLSVCKAMKIKHPASLKLSKSAVLTMTRDLSETAFHPNIFGSLDSNCVRWCALNTFGSAGSSGADAFYLRRLCTAFGKNLAL